MTTPIWLFLGVIIGLFGFFIDPDRNIHSLIRGILLGIVGALQGLAIATILSTIPLSRFTPSPIFLSFVGGLLLLTLGKVTRRAF